MSNTTKRALEASLKKLLLQKPLDKITIQDLTTDCGISRMAFYYHFKDIYDLVEWACVEDGKRALQGKRTYNSWQEGLEQIFKAVLENKPFIMNVYRSVSKEQIESYLYKQCCQPAARRSGPGCRPRRPARHGCCRCRYQRPDMRFACYIPPNSIVFRKEPVSRRKINVLLQIFTSMVLSV